MKMKKRNILKLAGLLEENARNPEGAKFDLDFYAEGAEREMPLNCSTACCAIGLAALSGQFPEMTVKPFRVFTTYKLNNLKDEVAEQRPYKLNIHLKDELAEQRLAKKNRGIHSSFLAAMHTFGMSNEDAVWFFLPPHSVGARSCPNKGKGAEAELDLARALRHYVETGVRT